MQPTNLPSAEKLLGQAISDTEDKLFREIASPVKTIRIQRKRTKGWKMPANTVYVGRPTKWGNPYKVTKDWHCPGCGGIVRGTTTREAVEKYRDYLTYVRTDVKKLVSELKGKNLACWCPLDQPCHADILLKLANESEMPDMGSNHD